MENNFTMQGTEFYLIQCLEDEFGLGTGDAEDVFYYLIQHQEMLSAQENIEKRQQQEHPGQFELTFLNTEYYINVKIATIVICALLLDSKLPLGFMSAFLALIGLPSQAVIKLNEEEGEKCIVKETLRLSSKMGTGNILKSFKGECCNADMKCKYRNGEYCRCAEENVLAIYEHLVQKNMFQKITDGKYRYCW